MTELSTPWTGRIADGAPGDAGPYSDDRWSDIWRAMTVVDSADQCVIQEHANRLAVTNPVGTTITIASGAAFVDGKFYENDANVSFTVVVPGAGSNYYTIVLRKSWAAQTVRLAMLGPNTVSPPVATQTDGTTWEVRLATVQVTNAGVITLTDLRLFTNTPGLQLQRRQGGDVNIWATPGTTDYSNFGGHLTVQAGAATLVAASPGVTVTFPIAYSTAPLVFVTALTAGLDPAHAYANTVTATQCTITHYDAVLGIPIGGTVFWVAIGS